MRYLRLGNPAPTPLRSSIGGATMAAAVGAAVMAANARRGDRLRTAAIGAVVFGLAGWIGGATVHLIRHGVPKSET